MTFKQVEKIVKPIGMAITQLAVLVVAALGIIWGVIEMKNAYVVYGEIVIFVLAGFVVFVVLIYFNYKRQAENE